MDLLEPLKKLIGKRQYKEAEELAKKHGAFDALIELLTSNRHAKQATLILKKNKIPWETYPKLVERLRKRYVRYVTETVSVEQAEVRFLDDRPCMAILAEDLCYKKAVNESLSLVQRHQLEELIVKTELRELLGEDFEYVENKYLLKDEFSELTRSDGAGAGRRLLEPGRPRRRPRASHYRRHA